MPTSLRIVNIVQLVLFGLLVFGNLRQGVATGGWYIDVLVLLPPGVALIAGIADSRPLASWAALIVNTLWALAMGYMTLMCLRTPVPWVAVLTFAFVLLALWNVAVAWLRLFQAEETVKKPTVESTL